MKRLLLLIPSLSYRASDFLSAADRLGVEVVVGSDKRQTLEDLVPGKTLTLDFDHPKKATERTVRFAKQHPIQAVVSTDEDAIITAAMISKALGLPHNPVSATAAARDKARLRETLTAASVPTPSFQVFSTDDSPGEIARKVPFPCVLKPTFLSASRGVIRADDQGEFTAAFHRILDILKDREVRRKGGPAAKKILVEEYIAGKEVALEGLLQKGQLSLLALFDKPDPLEGPFFEETIYVTPSRLPSHLQEKILKTTERATEAIGLKEGPVHAEIR
ncbi:MAG TPA: ATP-grasp domain-containing protein, partial [Nitrospiria bacterium]|nr:ATP-grasp domain-containing protein [Nitrospiria bacterium]